MATTSSTLSSAVTGRLSTPGLIDGLTTPFSSNALVPRHSHTHIRSLQCPLHPPTGFIPSRSAFTIQTPLQRYALQSSRVKHSPLEQNGVSKVSASAAGAEAYPDKRSSEGPTWLKKLAGSSAPPASDIIWAALGAFASMASLSYLDKHLVHRGFMPLTIGPMAAVAIILNAIPEAPVASKWSIFVSHVGAAAIGIAAFAMCGPGWVARSVAVAATVAFMQFTGSLHPPAGGLALLFVDSASHQSLGWRYLLFPGLAAAVVLVLVSEGMALLRKSIRF